MPHSAVKKTRERSFLRLHQTASIYIEALLADCQMNREVYVPEIPAFPPAHDVFYGFELLHHECYPSLWPKHTQQEADKPRWMPEPLGDAEGDDSLDLMAGTDFFNPSLISNATGLNINVNLNFRGLGAGLDGSASGKFLGPPFGFSATPTMNVGVSTSIATKSVAAGELSLLGSTLMHGHESTKKHGGPSHTHVSSSVSSSGFRVNAYVCLTFLCLRVCSLFLHWCVCVCSWALFPLFISTLSLRDKSAQNGDHSTAGGTHSAQHVESESGARACGHGDGSSGRRGLSSDDASRTSGKGHRASEEAQSLWVR